MTSLFSDRRSRKKTLLLAETVFLFFGFLCLAWAGYMTAQSIASNSWENYRFDQTLAGKQPSVFGYTKYLWDGDQTTPHAAGEDPAMDGAHRSRLLRVHRVSIAVTN